MNCILDVQIQVGATALAHNTFVDESCDLNIMQEPCRLGMPIPLTTHFI